MNYWLKRSGLLLGALVVGGLVAIGLAVVTRNISSPSRALGALGAVFSPTRERLTLTPLPERVTQGMPFELRWNHAGSAGGVYRLTYPCSVDLELSLLTAGRIPCNTPVALAAASSIILVASSSRTAAASLPVAIDFVPSDAGARALAAATVLAIMPAPEHTSPPPPTAPVVAARTASPPAAKRLGSPPVNVSSRAAPLPSPPPAVNPPSAAVTIPVASRATATGTPDLALRIIDVGTINETTGAITSTNTFAPGLRIAVVFDILNIGSAPSGPWQFGATLPIYGGFFTSEPQPSLGPGGRIRYTLGFGELLNPGPNTAVFTADPENRLKDRDRSNDSAAVILIRNY